jgi:hypothetical protein
MYVVGRKNSVDPHTPENRNGLVEVAPHAFIDNESRFLDAVVANHGGDVADYSLYGPLSPADEARASKADDFVLEWTGDAVTGLDFADEDGKRVVDFIPDKTVVDGDGVDVATVTVTLYEADGSTVASGVNANPIVPIQKGLEVVKTRIDFTAGVATIQVKGTEGKELRIPAVEKIENNNVRVREIAKISILEVF